MFEAQTSEKVKASVEMQVKNSDLAATLLLWFGHAFAIFLSQGKTVIIKETRGDFQAEAHNDEVLIHCPSQFLETSISPAAHLMHKIGWRLGSNPGPFAMSQARIVERYAAAKFEISKISKIKEASCHFLLRIDDFPSPYKDSPAFLKFHQIAAEARVPYLLGVTPLLDRGQGAVPLSENELAILRRCSNEGAALALHGFTHKNRYRKYNSELMTMPPAELEKKIQESLRYFRSNQLSVNAFIAPFNTYDANTISVITKYFPVICGGPESFLSLGNRIGPSFLKGSLYVPSYRGVYDVRLDELEALRTLAARAQGFVLPITLHWPNEIQNDFQTLKALLNLIKNSTMDWNNLTGFISKGNNL